MCTAFVILSFHHTNNINTNIKINKYSLLLFKNNRGGGNNNK